jgi:hypothetical protein
METRNEMCRPHFADLEDTYHYRDACPGMNIRAYSVNKYPSDIGYT